MQTLIRWPMETYDGDYLLYLLETPRVVRGEGQCSADYVNPLNVTVSPHVCCFCLLRDYCYVHALHTYIFNSSTNFMQLIAHTQTLKCIRYNMTIMLKIKLIYLNCSRFEAYQSSLQSSVAK